MPGGLIFFGGHMKEMTPERKKRIEDEIRDHTIYPTSDEQEAMDRLFVRIQHYLRHQDNRATGNPIFCVMDTESGDVDAMPIAIFFTKFGAELFADQCRNKYRHPLWVYIKSGNESDEWRAVRHFFGGKD